MNKRRSEYQKVQTTTITPRFISRSNYSGRLLSVFRSVHAI
jgi:hypothetical protein